MQSLMSIRDFMLKCFFFSLALLVSGCNEEDQTKQKNDTKISEKAVNQDFAVGGSENDDSEESDTLVVGTSADYMPFEFIRNGEVAGFDIDLINAIVEVLKTNIIIRDMQFYSLIPALQNGDINVVISGMFETPDRKREVDFSKPYYKNDFAVLISGSYDQYDPIKPGMTIGVQTGTLMHSWVVNQGLDIKIMTMDRTVELVEDLKNNRLDGILIDDISARDIIKMNPDAGLSSVKLKGVEETGISIAVKKNAKLLKKINHALDTLEKNGTLQKIKDNWGM